ncbi:hypothetical protein Q1695_006537 [Nippostrongylus brasiliensis]|nr:hypothetical protein Q1695_006537 [Nippostrongylus brasiliensis]
MSKKMAAMVVQLSPYVTSLDIQEFTATYWVSTEDLRVECDPNLDPEELITTRMRDCKLKMEEVKKLLKESTRLENSSDSVVRSLTNVVNMQSNAIAGIAATIVVRQLRILGYRKVMSSWVARQLRDSEKASRMSIAESLLLRPHRKDFLKDIVTGDESWVLYVNHTRQSQWLPPGEPAPRQPKPGRHQKKVLLCCWWDSEGMIYWELMDSGNRVTALVYATQLQTLADVMRQKRLQRKSAYLLHDSARPHVARATRQKIQDLGWEVLPHPPYSPDTAPSDYHLFRALKQHLRDTEFDSLQQLEMKVTQFFCSQPPEFWRRGIESLPEKCGRVIDLNGDYIID